MEEMNNQNQNDRLHDHGDHYCHCGYWGHGHHGRFGLPRLVLALLALSLVFCLGVKLGELKGELRGSGWGHERGGYMMYGNPNMMYKTMQPGMFFQQQLPLPTATTTPKK